MDLHHGLLGTRSQGETRICSSPAEEKVGVEPPWREPRRAKLESARYLAVD